MAFSKSFPRYVGKSTYPVWEEVSLSELEEKDVERVATKENVKVMEKCINNAEKLIERKKLKNYQSDMIKLAVALFEKRASHEVFYKESRCKVKFNEKFGKD